MFLPSTEHVGKSGVYERPAEPSPEPAQVSFDGFDCFLIFSCGLLHT